MSQAPRILVMRGGAIGDFVLTLPALCALRERWPEATIELLGYPHIARLAEIAGLADRVRSLDEASVARLFSLDARIEPEQRDYLCSFDIILSYLYDPGETVRENLRGIGAPEPVYGPPQVQEGHAANWLLRPLEQLAIFPGEDACPRLDLPEEHRRRGRQRLERFGKRVVVLHPGSGSPAKNWPLERYVNLAGRLKRELGVTAVCSLGEADRDIRERLSALAPELPVLTDLDLVELAPVLSATVAYVGNDSGITHLAAAVGVPVVVALFGPTDARRWRPRGPHVEIVQAAKTARGRMEGISEEQVWESLKRHAPRLRPSPPCLQ